ncbi:MAG: arginine--tRNA ligase [Candidatus Margulisiibacteriota bacterium]
MLLKEYLREHISKYVDIDTFSVEIPKNPEHGDYATNAAFLLGKQNKVNPVDLAKDLSQKLSDKNIDAYNIGPFINFRLTNNLLASEVMNIGDDYGKAQIGRKQKVLLEFVSANPTGPLHIGHGRWAVLGDVLKRMLCYTGYDAKAEFYVNDAGNQVNNLRKSVEAVRKGQPIPEDGYHGEYIKDLAKTTDDPIEVMMAEQKEVLDQLHVPFDTWFREQQLHAAGEVEKVGDYLDTYEKDGAVWFKTTEYGDDKDRVLIKATGDPTYFAADIAYHHNKLERGFKKLINIWGADHHGYVARIQIGLKSELEKHNAELQIIIGQLVNLFRDGEPVRMSKRTGEMITLEEVMEEIGVDATRYFMVRYSPDTPIDFDLGLAKKETMDNPVYYIQYAHARICSILRNAGSRDQGTGTRDQVRAIHESPQHGSSSSQSIECHPELDSGSRSSTQFPGTPELSTEAADELITNDYERALAKKLVEFPDEVADAAQNAQPHRITQYAEDLAAVFHAFYHNCRVISDDADQTAKRMLFVKATQTVLHIILEKILGINAPERM